MAGEINFGILDTKAPGNIANSFYEGLLQRQQNALAQAQLLNAQNANRLADLTYGEEKNKIDRKNEFINLSKGWGGDTTDEQRILSMRNAGYSEEADKLDKALADRRKSQAESMEKFFKATKQLSTSVMAIPTKENAHAAIDASERLSRTLGIDMSQEFAAQRKIIDSAQSPQDIYNWGAGHAADADKLLPQIDVRNLGRTTETRKINPLTAKVAVTDIARNTQSPDNAATVAATMRGQNMTDLRAREANTIQKEAARTQLAETPDGLYLIDKGTGIGRPALNISGEQIQQKDSPKYLENKQREQLGAAISMARTLIPKATSSGFGSAMDRAANLFGKSTEGADAASQLDTISGWMIANVPRMEGPQSDNDAALYEKMAASVADRTKPASQRLAAVDVLEKLQNKYAGNTNNAQDTGASKHIVVNGQSLTAKKAPDGKFYVEKDGKYFEVR